MIDLYTWTTPNGLPDMDVLNASEQSIPGAAVLPDQEPENGVVVHCVSVVHVLLIQQSFLGAEKGSDLYGEGGLFGSPRAPELAAREA